MTLKKTKLLNIGFCVLLVLSCGLLLYVLGLLPVKPEWDMKEFQVDHQLITEPPTIEELHKLSHKDLAVLYHRYINTRQVLCRRIVRIGNLGDGGWELCEDREFIPTSPCLVYSFGINNDFSFDDKMAERYNCDVYSFDPSMLTVDEGKRGNRQWFYQLGLSEKTTTLQTGWQVYTLKDVLKRFNHTQTKLDVLKIDVEKYEWLSLTQIFETGGFSNVHQLLIEFHISMVGGDPERLEYIQALGVLRFLYDNGFRIMYTHRNLWCSFLSRLQNVDEVGCHEVSFIHIP